MDIPRNCFSVPGNGEVFPRRNSLLPTLGRLLYGGAGNQC
jgi:hypothetical protein